MKRLLTFLTALLIAISAIADEGMWLLSLLGKQKYDTMKRMGLQLTPEQIYNINNACLKDAVVIFNGGCTGEMVSDEGLLFTNHHCGFDAIQSHSTLEHDYLEEGFWASSRKDELKNPEMFVTFLIRIEVVTERILSQLHDTLKEQERKIRIGGITKEIQAEATKGTHYEAEIKTLFEGNEYYLFVYETFRDIRLVGAPPSSIGKFGGDTDNWMWPRHTGDFSIFRVYASPDGKPAEYSEENVPYKPRHHFPISLRGVEKGDFSIVMGYPGTTDRYITSFGVEELNEIVHPVRVKIRTIRQQIILDEMQKNPKVKIQYASKYSHSSNYWKYSIGQMNDISKNKLIETCVNHEAELQKWIDSDSLRKVKYASTLGMIKQATLSRMHLYLGMQYLREGFLQAVEPVMFVYGIETLAEELSKTEKDNYRIHKEVEEFRKLMREFYKDYDYKTDLRVARSIFKVMRADLSNELLPDIFQMIDKKYKGNTDKYIMEVYQKSIFTDSVRLNKFLENPSLKGILNDPYWKLSHSVINKYRGMMQANNMVNDIINVQKRQYMKAYREMNADAILYPDANFTMRLTYGKVSDYAPRDAIEYKHFTTLSGIIQKEKPGDMEFDVPARLKELYLAKDFGRYAVNGDIPVCYITDNDITGGNSGSPVINGKGELTGIAFDGNWEAMASSLKYDPLLQKCICVDIRYVLFIIDKFAGATYLLDELDIIE